MSFTWHFILTNLIKINFVVFDLQGDELNEAQFDFSDSYYVIILGMSWTKQIEMHWFMFLSDPSPIIGNACQWLPP